MQKQLINKRHFEGVYEGSKEIKTLREEIADYIEVSDEYRSLVTIYINVDGAI